MAVLTSAPVVGVDRLTADEVVRLAATLPRWDVRLDDDPNWLRPVEAAGLVRLPLEEGDGHAAFLAAKHGVRGGLPPLVDVPTELVVYTGQQNLRIDALAHYLLGEESREVRWPDAPAGAQKLFDFEGWYGNDHPVVFWHVDGYCVLDGNNRCAAARLAGRPTVAAHALGGPAA